MALKKVVIIGPESTGKSTLTQQLAEHFNTAWLPEYAREYLETNGKDYAQADLLIIAKHQIAVEDQMIQQLEERNEEWLFIDTDLVVIKVWSEFVFGNCDTWILCQIAERKYDGYLLCDVDLPWVKDNLREYPDVETRQTLLEYYKENMVNQQAPWTFISGDYEQRILSAINFTQSLKDIS
ncbi:MAG: AAA family ATPase [Ginsengibacter sp.]